MAFLNQRSCLITDSKSNLYNFLWTKEGINLAYFNKVLAKVENTILIENGSLEFDVAIDKSDNLYVICQKNNGSIVLASFINDKWETSNLVNEQNEKVFNLSILVCDNKVNILYCVTSKEKKNIYRIYHHRFIEDKWETIQLDDISIREVLNPFTVIPLDDKIYIGYYDLINGEEQIFLKVIDTVSTQWEDKIQLTFSPNNKLYLDMILTTKKDLSLTYSELIEGNLVVKYEKFIIGKDKIVKALEEVLSNPSNSSYPTLVNDDSKLWVVWTEYENLMSCYTSNNGLSWSPSYIWKESKAKDFIRHKFSSNEISLNNQYILNHSFGTPYPDITFMGFGSLEGASEVPLKTKKKDEVDDENMNNTDFKEIKRPGQFGDISKDITKLIEEVGYLEERIKKLENSLEKLDNSNQYLDENIDLERLEALENRINEVENYINKRRRGPIFSPRY